MALVIFDLDGTLVDSVDGIAYSMNRVLKSMGYEGHDIKTYKSFVGNGIKRLVELSVPEDISETMCEMAYKQMLVNYQEFYDYNIRVYEGIYPLLDQLVEAKCQLAMVTNKHQSMAEPIMAKYFSDYPFKSIVGRSEANPKKPDPTSVNKIVKKVGIDKKDVYFVGDSEVDLMTARNAEVNDIIVSWGFRKRADLAMLKPSVIVDQPIDIVALVKG